MTEKFNKETKVFILVYFAFILINTLLSLLSWSDISRGMGWVASIKQNESMKIRHILQMGPQILLLLLLAHFYLKLSFKKTITLGIWTGSFLAIEAELVQLLSSTRIFSYVDILWNLYAVILAISLFSLLRRGDTSGSVKVYPVLSDINIFFFFTSVLFLFYQSILFVPFSGDDFKIVMATNNPLNTSWDYISSILLMPTNGGVQYRPMSYYFSGIMIKPFIGLTTKNISIIAILILSSSVFLYFKFLFQVYKKYSVSYFLATILLLGPWFTKLITSFRGLFKYSLNLFLLMLGLNLVVNGKWTPVKTLLLTVLFSVCILNHEGSIVFPMVVFLVSQKKLVFFKKSPHSLLIFLPSLIYLLLRFFKWGVPQKGFMALSFSTIEDVFFHHISVISSFYYSSSYALGLSVSMLIVLAIIVSFKKNQKRLMSFVVCFLMLGLPFSLLDNHVSKSHTVWLVPFYILIIFESFKLLREFVVPRLKSFDSIKVVVSVGVLILLLQSSIQEKTRYYRNGLMLKTVLSEVDIKIKNIKNKKDKASIMVEIPRIYDVNRYDIRMTAAALAYYYPEMTFLVSNKSVNEEALSKGGFYYFFEKDSKVKNFNEEFLVKDPFWRTTKTKLPKSFDFEIKLPPLSGNFNEHYHRSGEDTYPHQVYDVDTLY